MAADLVAPQPKPLVDHRSGRADRSGRRAETAALNAPITAAFIGLLLMHDGTLAAEAPAEDDAGEPVAPEPISARTVAAAVSEDAVLGLAESASPLQLTSATDDAPEPVAGTVSGGTGGVISGAANIVGVTPASPVAAAAEPRAIEVSFAGLEINSNTDLELLDLGALKSELTVTETARGLGAFAHLEREIEGATDGDDVLTGGDTNDYASGGAGNDRIYGLAGDDMLYGDAGDDIIHGGDGKDIIQGGIGADHIYGEAGYDEISGGHGDDVMSGGAGSNVLLGDRGDDRFILEVIEGAFDLIYDTLGANVVDVAWAPSTALSFDSLGGSGAITIAVDGTNRAVLADFDPAAPAFSVVTADGAFELPGAFFSAADGFANRIDGTDGDNRLWGFGGDDLLAGGAGADTYVIDVLSGGVDTILDADAHPNALSVIEVAGVTFEQLTTTLVDDTLVVSVDGKDAFRIADFATERPFVQLELADGLHSLPGVNNAPAVTGVMVVPNIREGAAYDIELTDGLFVDIDPSDTLRFSATLADGSALPGWITVDPTTGSLHVDAPLGSTGTYGLTLRATDPSGEQATTTFDLNVWSGNVPPQLVEPYGTLNVVEGGTIHLDPATHFTDDDDDRLTLEVRGAGGETLPVWLGVDATSGVLAVAEGPAAAAYATQHGSLRVEVRAVDERGHTSDWAELELNIDPLADLLAPPDAVSIEQNQTETLALAGRFADAAGATLTATLADGSALPVWLTFDASKGVFTIAPGSDDIGALTIDVRASDAAGHSDAETIRVTVLDVNDAPQMDPLQPFVDQSVTEGAVLDLAFARRFSDVDVGDVLVPEMQREGGGALPDWLVFDATSGTLAIVEGAEAAAFGNQADATIAVQVRAVDQAGAASAWSDPWVLEIEALPDLLDDRGTINAFEDDPLAPVTLTGRFTTATGAVLSASLAGGDALPDWLSFDATTGTFTGTPEQDDVGVVQLEVRATDAAGHVDGAAIELRINNTNDAPTVTGSVPDLAVMEGAPIAITLPANLFDDVDLAHGDALTLSAPGLPDWLHFDAAAGTITGTAKAVAADTTFSITLRATDTGGEAVTTAFDLTVAAGNEPPYVATTSTPPPAFEGQAYGWRLPDNTFRDPDGDALMLRASQQDGSPLPDWLTFDADNGRFSGTPGNGDGGTLGLRVTATDPGGLVAVRDVALTINHTNDAPVVDRGYVDSAVTEGTVLALDVPAHFSDADAGDVLTPQVRLADGALLPDWLAFDAAAATLHVVAGPEAAAHGRQADPTIAVQVRVVDDTGAASAWTTPWVLEIVPLPDLLDTPAAIAAAEDQPLTTAALSGRYTSAAGATLAASLAGGGALPAWLGFDPATGIFTGTPGQADVGVLRLEISATDAAGHVDVETVELVVANTNDAPTVAGDLPAFAVPQGGDVAIDLPADLFQDLDLAHGDRLTLAMPGLPDWLAFDATAGRITGTAPSLSAAETFALTVVATDNAGATAAATVTLDVRLGNRGPTAAETIEPVSATEGDAYEWVLPATAFSDPDGDALKLAATLADGSALPAWLRFDPATRTFSGTPGDDDPGALQLRIKATDPEGLSVTADFALNVANTNDAPIALTAPAGQAFNLGAAMTPVDAAALFHDPDLPFGDALTFRATLDGGDPLPAGLSFDGSTLSGTPVAAGRYEIDIVAADVAGAEATQSVLVEVSAPSNAADVALTTSGTLPDAVLPPRAERWDEGFYYDHRLYKLTPEAIPEAYAPLLTRFETVSISHVDHVVLHGSRPAAYGRAVIGGDEANTIVGGGANDIVIGQGGDDVLSGGAGDDQLYGGAGDDVLAGGFGADRLEGGAGSDRYEIGGLHDGAVDSIYDADGANVIDVDGAGAEQMSFGMDGGDLLVAVDGAEVARVENFEAGEATFDILADDGSVGHDALVASIAAMRAAYGRGETVALDDVLADYLPAKASAGMMDPAASFAAAGDTPELDLEAPAPASAEDVAAFSVPDGAASHEAGAAGLASKTQDDEPSTFA